VPSLWYTPLEVFTHTWPLPEGGAFWVEGDEPPDDFDDFAGAELAAVFVAGAGVEAGVAVGFAAGAAAGLAAGAALLPELDVLADPFAGVVSRFERDFFAVVPVLPAAALSFDAAAGAAAVVFEESADAFVESAAAAFFERDFLVVPVEASAEVLDASADESADESAAAFFERDFLVVLVEASAEDLEASADESVDESAAAFFLRFDVPVVDESLELALESLEDASAAAFFFFFFAVVVLLLESELEADPLLVSCALVAIAPIETSARTNPALASAISVFCHIVFMIVSPVRANTPRACPRRHQPLQN
jgi:hypothetical protein